MTQAWNINMFHLVPAICLHNAEHLNPCLHLLFVYTMQHLTNQGSDLWNQRWRGARATSFQGLDDPTHRHGLRWQHHRNRVETWALLLWGFQFLWPGSALCYLPTTRDSASGLEDYLQIPAKHNDFGAKGSGWGVQSKGTIGHSLVAEHLEPWLHKQLHWGHYTTKFVSENPDFLLVKPPVT
jgi:hypothetical protein